MDIRHWDDQPEFSAEAIDLIPCFWVGQLIGQIVEDGGVYYLTLGNLFGSQTVKSADLAQLGQIIKAVSGLEEGKKTLTNTKKELSNRFPGVEIATA